MNTKFSVGLCAIGLAGSLNFSALAAPSWVNNVNPVYLNYYLQEAINQKNWDRATVVIDRMIELYPERKSELSNYRKNLESLALHGPARKSNQTIIVQNRDLPSTSQQIVSEPIPLATEAPADPVNTPKPHPRQEVHTVNGAGCYIVFQTMNVRVGVVDSGSCVVDQKSYTLCSPKAPYYVPYRGCFTQVPN